MKKVLAQKRSDAGEIYSLHEPAVQCISKGMMNKWKASFLSFLQNLIWAIHLIGLQLTINNKKTKMSF
ncbi:MAG: hypothetical protein ICV84_18570 [Flavisolibacter sp.]|nr:hypothetical protein [Flavisolibacter sp.]